MCRRPDWALLAVAQDGGLLVGAAVTQEELIDKLLASCQEQSSPLQPSAADVPDGARAARGAGSGLWSLLGYRSALTEAGVDPSAVWMPLAKHLQRIAGNQVRRAAPGRRRFALPVLPNPASRNGRSPLDLCACMQELHLVFSRGGALVV